MTNPTAEQRPAVEDLYDRRIGASLTFHRERIEWLSEVAPAWDDGEPVGNSFAKVLRDQSIEAIDSLKRGSFVAGGDA